MEQMRRRGFVGYDTLEFVAFPGVLLLDGKIACLGGIVVTVWKRIVIVDGGSDPLVQTERYAYNASVRGWETFLRVDNAHAHGGHADEHHRHVQDWRTGADLPGSPQWVGAGGWPTLGDFVEREVWPWYDEHRDELPEPDDFPSL